jgi:hypothetical protein
VLKEQTELNEHMYSVSILCYVKLCVGYVTLCCCVCACPATLCCHACVFMCMYVYAGFIGYVSLGMFCLVTYVSLGMFCLVITFRWVCFVLLLRFIGSVSFCDRYASLGMYVLCDMFYFVMGMLLSWTGLVLKREGP